MGPTDTVSVVEPKAGAYPTELILFQFAQNLYGQNKCTKDYFEYLKKIQRLFYAQGCML